jgi:hypothetical protein
VERSFGGQPVVGQLFYFGCGRQVVRRKWLMLKGGLCVGQNILCDQY